MGNEAEQIVNEIIHKTTSELIIFFILVMITLVIVFLPLYRMMVKDRKERNVQNFEREKQIMSVITANTEVISRLKTTLDFTSNNTNSSFTRIHDRIDKQSEKQTELGADTARIQSTLDEIVRKQQSTSDDIKKIMQVICKLSTDRDGDIT